MNVSVFDMRVRQLYRNRFDASLKHGNTIDLGNVQGGFYLLNLTDGIKTIIKKMIIE
ncbi:T9SS type A sorting domain-containing protein [Paucihalobacter ruber]|uniref:T9SS type A sorting domain-containing protein n=1 Tax=Paucihalobacter ruber TaxID=2567861 RepID=A0A506PMJ8_9FLAO|nr:T9SS type A sorting domain-containing protein [Paucihalobacter ruber]TPV35096.1 T9SS type A sorting domain-containing protein [Paucihalobacter ruber]